MNEDAGLTWLFGVLVGVLGVAGMHVLAAGLHPAVLALAVGVLAVIVFSASMQRGVFSVC